MKKKQLEAKVAMLQVKLREATGAHKLTMSQMRTRQDQLENSLAGQTGERARLKAQWDRERRSMGDSVGRMLTDYESMWAAALELHEARMKNIEGQMATFDLSERRLATIERSVVTLRAFVRSIRDLLVHIRDGLAEG